MNALQHRQQPRSSPIGRPGLVAPLAPMRDPLHPMHHRLLGQVMAANAPIQDERYSGPIRLAVFLGGAVGSWGLVIVAFRAVSTLI